MNTQVLNIYKLYRVVHVLLLVLNDWIKRLMYYIMCFTARAHPCKPDKKGKQGMSISVTSVRVNLN